MATELKSLPIADTITAWRCIGCGRLDSPANCVGICEDRKIELVTAWDYAEALSRLEQAIERNRALEALVAKLAHSTPRETGWKDSYLALQAQAQKLLTA